MPSLNTGNAILSNAIAVDSSYNVGIGGAASGSFKLQVTGTSNLTGALTGTSATFSGNGLFGGSTNPGNAGGFTLSVGIPGTTAGGLQLWAATNQSSFVQFGDSTTAADNYRGYVGYNHATDTLSLGTASADKVTISSTGAATFSSNIGIKVSGRSESLAVEHSTGNVSAGFFYNTGIANGQSYGLTVYAGTNASDRSFLVSNQGGANTYLYVRGDGNVGIGTSSPAARLTIATPSGSSEALRIICADTIGDGFISYYRTSGERKAFIGYGGSNDDDFYISQQENAPTLFFTNNTERMRITSGGYVLIPSGYQGTSYFSTNFTNIDSRSRQWRIGNDQNQYGDFVIAQATSQGGSSYQVKLLLNENGFTKASNNGTFYASSSSYHELRNNSNDNETVNITHTGSSPYGISLYYVNATPNNSSNWFAYFGDSIAQRFSVRSNGGVYNYTGNNVPLSDQRMKKEITPLESYWNKFKEIEMVKFKYIDQDHDDFNIGVISQQIESIMPEFVDVWDDKNIPEDGKPLMGVYMEDLHNMTMKVLQEAMARIEEQQAQIEAQQQTINSLINR